MRAERACSFACLPLALPLCQSLATGVFLKALFLTHRCAAHATGGQACTETEFAIGLRGPSIGVSVNGMGAGAISSARLSRALLECFLDEETVSPTFKESCGEGFLAMLA